MRRLRDGGECRSGSNKGDDERGCSTENGSCVERGGIIRLKERSGSSTCISEYLVGGLEVEGGDDVWEEEETCRDEDKGVSVG